MDPRFFRMVDTTVHMVPEEYARMLAVVHSGAAVVLSAFRIPSDPSAVWIVLLFLAVAVRSLGPVGASWWRPLFTTVVVAGLVMTAIVHRSQGAEVALSVAVLVLLGMRLTSEVVGRGRVQRQQG